MSWTREEARQLGHRPFVAAHALDQHPLFTDAAICDVLDRAPRECVHVNTMSDDLTDPDAWQDGDPGDLSGEQLLAAVRRGRLWMNVRDLEVHVPAWGQLLQRLFAEIRAVVPDFAPVRSETSLLISSPTARVHYHADVHPSLLWHVRGRKRVWVYPPLDPRFVDREAMERVFAGEASEELPYDPAWDAHATVLDLGPGDVASWPVNAPHRIDNVSGLNVSFVTEYHTAASLRRARLWAANRFLGHRLGMPVSSTVESGPAAAAKVAVFRVARRLLRQGRSDEAAADARFQVDPDADSGHVPTDP